MPANFALSLLSSHTDILLRVTGGHSWSKAGLNEQQLVQLKLAALFALALVMVRSAALFVYLAGLLFLVACPLPAEVMLGMMPL
jgi:hypothetical protein